MLQHAGCKSFRLTAFNGKPQATAFTQANNDVTNPAIATSGQNAVACGSPLNDGPTAIALIQGLAGLGKTAIAAEAIDLWHHHFDYVLAFQVKPLPLTIDDFYRQFDERLKLA